MSHDAATPRSLADAFDHTRTVMVVTPDLTARPLTVQEVDGDTLRFLVSSEAEWATSPDLGQVVVTLADQKHNAYASATGRAVLRDDRALIEHLWNPLAGAFFDGEDDPTVRALEITVTAGEYWDGPDSRLGQAIGILRTAFTGDHGDSGESGPIDLDGDRERATR